MDGKSTQPLWVPETAVVSQPAAPIWGRSSTRDVPVDERFEYHRTQALANGARVEPASDSPVDFFAQNRFAMMSDGTAIADYEIDPCITRVGADTSEPWVEVGVLCAGIMHVHQGRDERTVVGAGTGLILLDATLPATLRVTRCAAVRLQLPRNAAAVAMGREAMSHRVAFRPLPVDPVSAQLARCLCTVRGDNDRDATRVLATLRTARALALVALANTRGAGHRWPDELEPALYLAACHQLAQHVDNRCATVAAVAATLQCSRAQLYRLFAARGQSVAGYLRELRMQRAADWLITRPGSPIGTIADSCGYSELVAFDKAFRRCLGMAPRDWRASHATVPDAAG